MKRIVPLAVALSGGALMLSQQKPARPVSLAQSIQELHKVNAVPPSVSTAIVNAQAQVLRQQSIVLQAAQQAKANPAAEPQVLDEQKKLEEAQKAVQVVAQQAAATPARVQVVSADQRQHLTDLVGGFYQEVRTAAASASAWETGLIIAGILFGLTGTILSVFSWNKVAAVASALVVVAGGVPKVFPVHQRAVYYRTLTNQSYSLLGALQIPYQMTGAEYDDGVARLQVLEDYRATKYPEAADVDSATESLFNDLNAAKTAQVEKH